MILDLNIPAAASQSTFQGGLVSTAGRLYSKVVICALIESFIERNAQQQKIADVTVAIETVALAHFCIQTLDAIAKKAKQAQGQQPPDALTDLVQKIDVMLAAKDAA